MAVVESGFFLRPEPDSAVKSQPVQSGPFRAPLTFSLSLPIYLSSFLLDRIYLVPSLYRVELSFTFDQGKTISYFNLFRRLFFGDMYKV